MKNYIVFHKLTSIGRPLVFNEIFSLKTYPWGLVSGTSGSSRTTPAIISALLWNIQTHEYITSSLDWPAPTPLQNTLSKLGLLDKVPSRCHFLWLWLGCFKQTDSVYYLSLKSQSYFIISHWNKRGCSASCSVRPVWAPKTRTALSLISLGSVQQVGQVLAYIMCTQHKLDSYIQDYMSREALKMVKFKERQPLLHEVLCIIVAVH